jgi:hypothetical protein
VLRSVEQLAQVVVERQPPALASAGEQFPAPEEEQAA